MKLIDALLLSASVAFFIMGLHQIMMHGFANGYWAVMVSTVLFFGLVYRRVNRNSKQAEKMTKPVLKKKKK